MQKPYIVPAAKKHTATLIFAHGLGDSGAGWMDLAKNWRSRGVLDHVKFIFPNAPPIPITVNGGMQMPGWYDILTFDDLKDKTHDEPGITKSRDYFNSLIKQEVDEAGIPSQRIIVGGFSQGGAMSIFTGLTTTYELGGLFALSAYLVLGHRIPQLVPAAAPNKGLQVFMGHGQNDPLVKYVWGKKTAEELEGYGFKVDFHGYPGLVHSASMDEIDDLEKYITSRLPELTTGAQSKA